MRGIETRIQEIRHQIFREVARMAYHTEWPVDKRIEELPYKIMPGEVANFGKDIFLDCRGAPASGNGIAEPFSGGAFSNIR